MGANEKHDATYHGGEYLPTKYMPTTDDVRDVWVDRKVYHLPKSTRTALVPTVQAEFDRWLETVRAEAKAEALNEAAHALDSATINIEMLNGDPDLKQAWAFRGSERKSIIQSLRIRADRHKENQK